MTTHKPLLSETTILFAVENLILNICIHGIHHIPKSELVYLLTQFDKIYYADYTYMDYINVFVALKADIDLIRYNELLNPNSENYDFVLNFSNEQWCYYNEFLKPYIGQARNALTQFSIHKQANHKNLEKYLKSLYEHYARLYIVRVDLGYLKESNSIGIKQFNQDFTKLRNRIANKDGCFKLVQGYAWTIEQAKDHGYHVHLLLIYNASKVSNGSYYAIEVGKMWEQIARYYGCYFNLNSRKYINELKARKCLIGLGLLSRNNKGDWGKLLTVAKYLAEPTKEQQRLRVKLKGMNCFSTGQFRTKSRRGID